MSAWTQLYNFGSVIIKRPSAWLLGILGAGATAAATGYVTDSFNPVETFFSEKVAELSCRYRQKPIANESQFTILVSPLATPALKACHKVANQTLVRGAKLLLCRLYRRVA
jgi:hypothetical protein